MAILLNNVSTNIISSTFKGAGGSHVVIIRGDDFGGGTVEIQVSSPNDSLQRFLPLVDGSFTENGQFKIDYLPSGFFIRAQLFGATSPSNVFVDIDGVVEVPEVGPPAPPFDSDLYIWLDASKEETIEVSSGLVFQWNDPRDNGRNVSQSSDTRKPISGAETKNGLNILRFQGDNRLTTTLSPVISNTAFTMFSVSSPSNPAAAMALEMYKSATTISAGLQQYQNVTGFVRSRNKSGGTNTSEIGGGNPADWNIVAGGMDTSGSPTITSRINNINGSASAIGFSADSYDQFLVGAGVIEPFNALFKHAEVLVYTKTLSLSEVDDVVQYLSDKWDIT